MVDDTGWTGGPYGLDLEWNLAYTPGDDLLQSPEGILRMWNF